MKTLTRIISLAATIGVILFVCVNAIEEKSGKDLIFNHKAVFDGNVARMEAFPFLRRVKRKIYSWVVDVNKVNSGKGKLDDEEIDSIENNGGINILQSSSSPQHVSKAKITKVKKAKSQSGISFTQSGAGPPGVVDSACMKDGKRVKCASDQKPAKNQRKLLAADDNDSDSGSDSSELTTPKSNFMIQKPLLESRPIFNQRPLKIVPKKKGKLPKGPKSSSTKKPAKMKKVIRPFILPEGIQLSSLAKVHEGSPNITNTSIVDYTTLTAATEILNTETDCLSGGKNCSTPSRISIPDLDLVLEPENTTQVTENQTVSNKNSTFENGKEICYSGNIVVSCMPNRVSISNFDYRDDQNENEKSSVTLKDDKLEGVKPKDAKLEEVKPKDANLEEAKPKEAKLEEVKPKEVKSEEVKPTEVKLEEVKPKEAKLEEVKPKEAKLEEVKPKEAKLEEVKQKEIKLEEVKPKEAKLEEVKPNDNKLEVKLKADNLNRPQEISKVASPSLGPLPSENKSGNLGIIENVPQKSCVTKTGKKVKCPATSHTKSKYKRVYAVTSSSSEEEIQNAYSSKNAAKNKNVLSDSFYKGFSNGQKKGKARSVRSPGVLPDTFHEGLENVRKGPDRGTGTRNLDINSEGEVSYSSDGKRVIRSPGVLPDTFHEGLENVRKGPDRGPGTRNLDINSEGEVSYSSDGKRVIRSPGVLLDTFYEGVESVHRKGGSGGPGISSKEEIGFSDDTNIKRVKRGVLPNSFRNSINGIKKKGVSKGPGFKTVKLNSKEEFSYSVGNAKDTPIICYDGNIPVDCSSEKTEQRQKPNGINTNKDKNNLQKKSGGGSSVLPSSFYKDINSVKKKGGSGGPGFKTIILNSKEEFSYSKGNAKDSPKICYDGNIQVDCFPEKVKQSQDHNGRNTDSDRTKLKEKSGEASEEVQVLPSSFYKGINSIKKKGGSGGPGFKTLILNSKEEFSYTTGNDKDTSTICYDGNIQVDCFEKQANAKNNEVKFKDKKPKHRKEKPGGWSSVLPSSFYKGINSIKKKGGSGGPGFKTIILNSKEEFSYSNGNAKDTPTICYDGNIEVNCFREKSEQRQKHNELNTQSDRTHFQEKSSEASEEVQVLPSSFYKAINSINKKDSYGVHHSTSVLPNSFYKAINGIKKKGVPHSTSVLPKSFYKAINSVKKRGGSGGPGFKTLILNSKEEFSYKTGNDDDTPIICNDGNIQVDCFPKQTQQDSENNGVIFKKKRKHHKIKSEGVPNVLPKSFYKSINHIKKKVGTFYQAVNGIKEKIDRDVLPTSFYKAIKSIKKKGGSGGAGFKTVILNSKEEFSYSNGNAKDTPTICYDGNIQVNCFPENTEKRQKHKGIKQENNRNFLQEESAGASGEAQVLPSSFYKAISGIRKKHISGVPHFTSVLPNSFYKAINSVKKRGGSGGPGFKTLILNSGEEFSYTTGNGKDTPIICYDGNIEVDCFPKTKRNRKHHSHQTGLISNERRSTSKGFAKAQFDLKHKNKSKRRNKHNRRF